MAKSHRLDIENPNPFATGIGKNEEAYIRSIAERIGTQVGQTVTDLMAEIMTLILVDRSKIATQSPFAVARITDRLLTANEIASRLHISKSKVYRMMRNGEIPTVRIGKTERVRAQDLEVFIQEHAVRRA